MQRLFENQTMFGFTFGGADAHNSVANRAIKVLLGTHLRTLMPKIRQRMIEGVEGQLQDALTKSDGRYIQTSFELVFRLMELSY